MKMARAFLLLMRVESKECKHQKNGPNSMRFSWYGYTYASGVIVATGAFKTRLRAFCLKKTPQNPPVSHKNRIPNGMQGEADGILQFILRSIVGETLASIVHCLCAT